MRKAWERVYRYKGDIFSMLEDKNMYYDEDKNIYIANMMIRIRIYT